MQLARNQPNFVYAQMAVLSSFLQVFILLGMYNFDAATTLFQAKNLCGCCFCPVCKLGLLLLFRPLLQS